MQGLEQLVTALLEPWDALVCTSRSALKVVQEAMACMHERLERRFQQTLPAPKGPQLPLIPLGIDPKLFHWQGRFASRQEQRMQARQQLGLSREREWCCSWADSASQQGPSFTALPRSRKAQR